MSDFDNLSDHQKTLLRIKLDGFIEAAVQAARVKNIGASEALSLTMLALAREAAAHAIKREKAAAIWENAVDGTYCNSSETNLRTVN